MTELRNTWALREVYFDEHGNPSMHREPVPMTREQAMAIVQSNPDTMTAIRMQWSPTTHNWQHVIPGGRKTDQWDSTRIADYNQGWNDYRKAVKSALGKLYTSPPEQQQEPVAWIYQNENLVWERFENIDGSCNEYTPLYTHPARGGSDDVVRDADRIDWLARNPVDALDVFGKSRPDEARFIRATIDAAMTAAAQAQKGGE